jgi:hypothetical protein
MFAFAGICRTEVFSYETCIFYTVLTSIVTLPRTELKKKVVDAPEILAVISSIPNLEPFLNALYSCNYAKFFKVCDVSRTMTPWTMCLFFCTYTRNRGRSPCGRVSDDCEAGCLSKSLLASICTAFPGSWKGLSKSLFVPSPW